jgi:hypothetical protein
MDEDKMIQNLQERFGLSKIQVGVIHFQLKEHFTKEKKMTKNSNKFTEVT